MNPHPAMYILYSGRPKIADNYAISKSAIASCASSINIIKLLSVSPATGTTATTTISTATGTGISSARDWPSSWSSRWDLQFFANVAGVFSGKVDKCILLVKIFS